MNPHEPPSAHHDLAVPVDQARAEALRARLHEALIGRAPTTTTTTERQELTVHTHPPEPRAHRTITIAAVVVATAGLAGVGVIATRDTTSTDDPPAVASPPPTTPPALSPPTTSPPATSPPTTSAGGTSATTSAPFPDDRIAEEILPPSDAFGADWALGPPWTLAMDGSIAAASPACSEFGDAFESPSRPASVTGRLYSHEDTSAPAMSSAYSVVFASEADAISMFEATADPDFIRACHDEYDVQHDAAGATSIFPYTNTLDGQFIDHDVVDLADLDVPVDQQWQAAFDFGSTGEYFRFSTTRVGRSVLVVMGVMRAFGEDKLADERFQDVVEGSAQRAGDALGVVVLDTSSDTAPTGTPLPDDQIAASALPIRDGDGLPEYGDGWTSAATLHRVEMRGDIAADVIECEPFLDAFESQERPAAVAFELAWYVDPPGAFSSTYAVVLADAAAAEAMFDATRDPRFVRECSPAYDQALYEATGQSITEPGFSYFPYFNDRPLPSITDGETYADVDQPDFGADEQWAIQLNYTTETHQVTTVRVGRVVVVIQSTKSANALTVDDNGRAVASPSVVQTEEDYHAIIRGVVQRTRDALSGIPLAQAG